PVTFAKGSYIVRMDQPYSRLADTLLDVQFVRGEAKVYDDTGWTLGYLNNVETRRVTNPDVLKVKMRPWFRTEVAPARKTSTTTMAIANHGETALARLRWAAPKARIVIADEEFKAGKQTFPAGTLLVDDVETLDARANLHLTATAIGAMPNVKTHELRAPRIALMHTWVSTQDEGWWRLALESMKVPYDYISTQDAARMTNLREQYDVILFPPVGRGATSQDIVNGYPAGAPMPWKKTELTPNLGVDETDDMRPGLGLTGVQNLTRFVEDGGLLITARDTSVFAVEYGLARYVRLVPTTKLRAPGTIVQGTVTDKTHPIARGYDATLPLYFAGSPLFRVGVRDDAPPAEQRPTGRGGKDDPDVPQGRPYVAPAERAKPGPGESGFLPPEDAPWSFEAYMPRVEDRPKVVVSFAEKDLLLSGMLEGADELSGKPAVIDVPRGKGHVILMSTNPMWRMNTSGLYALVMNAVMEMAQ
ncbi:MAG TPA: hypothetical protein VE010_10575, partial [Thermoanaerobaculia bacterium]|nr:hypothetical protein [Thermoanaerobaculia bacterium]